jgi:hypothetical protein
MNGILVATASGCRVFSSSGEGPTELAGRLVSALAPEIGGTCLAVVDKQDIWRRSANGAWSQVATTGIWLQSIVSVGGTLFGGAMDEAAMVRISPGGEAERLKSFDDVPGRSEWIAGGPPLGVRALTATADGRVILVLDCRNKRHIRWPLGGWLCCSLATAHCGDAPRSRRASHPNGLPTVSLISAIKH